jgi:hypothetical protein
VVKELEALPVPVDAVVLDGQGRPGGRVVLRDTTSRTGRSSVSDVAVLPEGIEHALGAGERAVPGARPSSRQSPM